MHFKIETISALPTDFSYRKLRLRADRKSGVPVRQPPARCAIPFTGLSWHGSLTWLSPCCSISALTNCLTGQQVSSWLEPPGQHMHRPSLHAASVQRFKALVAATQHQEAAMHSPYSAALWLLDVSAAYNYIKIKKGESKTSSFSTTVSQVTQ